MVQRAVRILDVLASNKEIRITMLSELLDISLVTLRRDLDHLEKRGIICRTHGNVTLDGADITGKRLALNYSIKQRIAKAAAELIEHNEIVMIGSGSCCALFAEELVMSQKNVTIITNSVFLANFICKIPGVKIILLGGYFQPELQVLAGSMTIKSADDLYTDKFFIGADGFIPNLAFTGGDHLCVETAHGLVKRAKKIFVLTEAAKFQRRGAFSLVKIDNIAGVFTDEKIPKDAEAALIKSNVKLYKVPATEEKMIWRHFSELPPIMYKEKEE